MPKVTEVKKAYPIFKKDMKKYQDRSSSRDEVRKLKRKSTGEHSASKLNRFCIGMFFKDLFARFFHSLNDLFSSLGEIQ